MSTVPTTWSDDELAAVATDVAERTPGVVELLPVVARRAVTVFRTGTSLEVAARLIVAVEPPPVETVRTFGRALRDAVQARTGLDVVVELSVADVQP